MLHHERIWTLIPIFMATSLFAQSQKNLTPPECQDEVMREARETFMSLYHARQENSSAVSVEDFRQASRNYAYLAESCYQMKYGRSPETGRMIDHGGILAENEDLSGSSRHLYGPGLSHGPSNSGTDLSNPVSDSHTPYVLIGRKWGSGTWFTSGSDVGGPGIAGGTVTYSFMDTGVDLGTHANDNSDNVAISGSCPDLSGSRSTYQSQIRAAFAAWEMVANIQFIEVTDSGHAFNASGASGDIRIGMHYFDGASGVLAHGYYPPPNGISAAGDIHFDVDENWRCAPEKTETSEFDIGIVMIHEIGHAIGIKHEPTYDEFAIMNPSYNASINFPLADDIQAAQQIYGSAFQDNLFFGTVGVNTANPSERLEVDGNIKLSSHEHWMGWKFNEGFISSGGEKPMFVSPGQVLMTIDADNDDASQFFAVGKDSIDPAKWTELFRVQENGRFGIGTKSPSEKLEVSGNIKLASSGQWMGWSYKEGLVNSGGQKPMLTSPGQVLMAIDADNNDTRQFFAVGKNSINPAKWTELFRVQENGFVGIRKTNPNYPMEFASGARVTKGGQFQSVSSRESKERIQGLTNSEAAEVVSRLEPVRFAYKSEPKEDQIGFIAEDVPNLVATKDRKTLAAIGIVAALTKVVQQQQETIIELSSKVAQLEEKIGRQER